MQDNEWLGAPSEFCEYCRTPKDAAIMSKVILFLAANPLDTNRLRLDEEIREIDEGIRRAKHREQYELKQKWAVRPDDLRRAMLDYTPQLVHFSGHGAGEKGIVLENNQGLAQPVSGEALSHLFALFPQVECVLLNACYSEIQAQAIAENVPYVVGMSQAVGDRAAITFAMSFYDALGSGQTVDFAYRYACNALELAGIPEHLTPVLKANAQLLDKASKTSAHPQYDR
jgi:hypothetical protein